MGLDANKWLSIITFAGITGLLIINADNFAKVISAVGSTSVDYVKAVQGR